MAPIALEPLTERRPLQRCRACGRARAGVLIHRWPESADVCPKCSDVARQVAAVEFGRLSPPLEAD